MRIVLVVDRSRVVRAVVRRCLEPYGCRVVEAAHVEASGGGEGECPALVLLEVAPSGSPDAALAALRRRAGWTEVPVVALVARDPRDASEAPLQPGVVGRLLKPFNPSLFDEAVHPVLGPPAAFVVGEEAGCAVVSVRALDAPVLAAVEMAMRRLAQHGCSQVILEFGRETAANAEYVTQLVAVVRAAQTAGLRPAVCALDARVRVGLNDQDDTRDTVCGATRTAVREQLRSVAGRVG